MASLYVLAVHDMALDAYMRPIFVPHRNSGIRAFQDEVNRAGSEMNRHPEDYNLYHLGEWDEQTSRFTNMRDVPELLIRGKDAIKGA